MKDVYTQEEWSKKLEEGSIRVLRHPYYVIGENPLVDISSGTIVKVANDKQDADIKFGLTEEQVKTPEDAVIIDPMDEIYVCREMIQEAVEEYLIFLANKFGADRDIADILIFNRNGDVEYNGCLGTRYIGHLDSDGTWCPKEGVEITTETIRKAAVGALQIGQENDQLGSWSDTVTEWLVKQMEMHK